MDISIINVISIIYIGISIIVIYILSKWIRIYIVGKMKMRNKGAVRGENWGAGENGSVPVGEGGVRGKGERNTPIFTIRGIYSKYGNHRVIILFVE